MKGNVIMQADAMQAYIQSLLSVMETWVRLPKHQWPESWIKRGFVDPVCPLMLALYGHPDSGGYWEKHAEDKLTKAGFKPIQDWKSCFWHPKYKMLLVLYVDGFKLAGPKNT